MAASAPGTSAATSGAQPSRASIVAPRAATTARSDASPGRAIARTIAHSMVVAQSRPTDWLSVKIPYIAKLPPAARAAATSALQRPSPSWRPASHAGTATRPWHTAMNAWSSQSCLLAESVRVANSARARLVSRSGPRATLPDQASEASSAISRPKKIALASSTKT